MIITIYTDEDDIPADIYEFGQNPISRYGYINEDFYLEDNSLNGRDRDPCISPEPTVRYSVPINASNEPMYYAWDDFEYCAVIEKPDPPSDYFAGSSDLPWQFRADENTYRYDMPSGRTFFVQQH